MVRRYCLMVPRIVHSVACGVAVWWYSWHIFIFFYFNIKKVRKSVPISLKTLLAGDYKEKPKKESRCQVPLMLSCFFSESIPVEQSSAACGPEIHRLEQGRRPVHSSSILVKGNVYWLFIRVSTYSLLFTWHKKENMCPEIVKNI